jgi:predicted RNA-binding protein with EMAP domain
VDFTIDLVSRLGDAYTFDDLKVTVVDVGGQTVKVVTPATLYGMKRDTVRGRDRYDAERLRRAFDLEG